MRQKFIYKSRRKMFLFMAVVFSAIAYLSMKGFLGLEIIPPRSHISPRAVGVFLFLSGLGVFWAVVCFVSFARTFGRSRFVFISESYLSAPQYPHLFKTCNVSLKSIKSMESKKSSHLSGDIEHLTLRHKGGKMVLQDNLFESRVKFVSFKQALKKYVLAAQVDKRRRLSRTSGQQTPAILYSRNYVYEPVAESDIQPYGLDKKIKGELYARGPGRKWAIDRSVRSYLRCVGVDHEIDRNSTYWDFLWEGSLISLEVEQKQAGTYDGCYLNHKEIVRFDLPAELENRRQEVQSDIYEAFAITVIGNLPPDNLPYKIQIDFPGGESYGT